ncbi:MAG TPA: hypothetical protein VFA39_06090 [Steroidobacteraceae bacterium]|nr:hypothetical protein [Steroidobacteraceae bacterium]
MTATTGSGNGSVTVARSALLTVTVTPSDDALSLEVLRLADRHLIAGAGKVTATLDGRALPLTAQPNGVYLASTRDEGGGAHTLDVVVSHDGIRELLTGTVALPSRTSALDFLQSHGMSAWWVLNIAVVLIAVLVISRRRR